MNEETKLPATAPAVASSDCSAIMNLDQDALMHGSMMPADPDGNSYQHDPAEAERQKRISWMRLAAQDICTLISSRMLIGQSSHSVDEITAIIIARSPNTKLRRGGGNPEPL